MTSVVFDKVMMIQKIRSWVQALRLYSFTTTLLPMLIGFALVPEISWVLISLIMASVFLVHAGTNMINDYHDFIHGVDQTHTRGSSRVLVNGQLTSTEVKWASLGCFALGTVAGLGVVWWTQRWGLLAFGVSAVLICYFYTASGFQLKKYGLGDLGVLIATGPLITSGIEYTASGNLTWTPFLAGLIPGLTAVNVLHTNNLRDVENDRKCGLWNLAHLPWNLGVVYWWGVLGAAYAVQGWLIWQGVLPEWTAVTLLLAGIVVHPRVVIERMALGHLLFNVIVAAGFSGLFVG